MPLQCFIRAEPTKGLFRLQAVARASEATSGRYEFFVDKQNDAGSSRNMQSGSFQVMPGQDQVLTTIILEGSAAGHFEAQLSLESQNGRISCHAP
jgi:hypothetical protein